MSSFRYLPAKDSDLVEWGTNLLRLASMTENYERWRIMPPTEQYANLLEDYTVKLEFSKSRNPLDIVSKNTARALFEKESRNFVQGFLARNVNLTDRDRRELGIPLHDTIPTNIPVPVTQVEGTLNFRGLGLIEVRDLRPATDKPDARAGHGVRIYYGILGESSENTSDKFRLNAAPTHGSDLPHSVFTRKKRHLFEFTKDRGKEVFFSMRYENSKGEAGPWGKVYQAFIP